MTDLEEVRPTEPEDETIAPTERCDEEEAWPGPEPGEYVLAPAPPSAPSTPERCEHGANPRKCLQCAGVVTRKDESPAPSTEPPICDRCQEPMRMAARHPTDPPEGFWFCSNVGCAFTSLTPSPAPSTEPDLSEFDRLMCKYIATLDDHDPDAVSDQTHRAASTLRSWVATALAREPGALVSRERIESWIDTATLSEHEDERRLATQQLEKLISRLADALEASQRDEAEAWAMCDALDAKVKSLAPHGTCGCSVDRPGDVCLHHSPKLASVTSRAVALDNQLRAVLAERAGDKRVRDEMVSMPCRGCGGGRNWQLNGMVQAFCYKCASILESRLDAARTAEGGP